MWVPVSIKPLLLVRQFGNSKILAFHMNSMHSILCLNLLSIRSHPKGPVMPIDVTLHEKASSKSFPNLKAEAVSVYIIQVTQQISELHGKAQVGSESHSHAHPDKTLRNQSQLIYTILGVLQQLPTHLSKSMSYASGSSYTCAELLFYIVGFVTKIFLAQALDIVFQFSRKPVCDY